MIFWFLLALCWLQLFIVLYVNWKAQTIRHQRDHLARKWYAMFGPEGMDPRSTPSERRRSVGRRR